MARHGSILSSTELSRNVFVPAEAMAIISGTPPVREVILGRYGTIALPVSGGNEVVGITVSIPDDWDGASAFTAKIHLGNDKVGGTRDVVLSVVFSGITDGNNLDVNDLAGANETVGLSAWGILDVHTFGDTFTPAGADEFLVVRLFRRGAEAADDFADDLHVLGMEFEYTPSH